MASTVRYTLPVPPGDPSELLVAQLWAAGAHGVWVRTDDVVAWFDDTDVAVPPGGHFETEPDHDWQEAWKAGIAPVHAGRIAVVPTWLAGEHDPGPDEITIVLDPGGAFGSGHHATTTLCLDLLQDPPLDGARVLDVGTGTGVLAIAALRLGAGDTVGVDVDPDAVEVARANAERNDVGDVLRLAVGSIDAATGGPFDVVVANLLTHTLVTLADQLVTAPRPGGTLIVSGVAVERADRVADALAEAGLAEIERHDRGEWSALRGRRPDLPRLAPQVADPRG